MTDAHPGTSRAMVTGGAGFIGSHVADALVRHGIEVTVLDDMSTGLHESIPHDAHLIEADVASPSVVHLVAQARPDLIVHAAAQVSVPTSVLDPVRDREVNLIGTENVITGAHSAGTRRLVFISSGGAIYGETSGAAEETTPAPQSPYGVHKLEAESRVRSSGIPHAVVRLSNVYGPRQRPGLEGGVVAAFLDSCLSHGQVTVFGDGHQARDLLHVSDAVDAILAATGAVCSGTWNVGTGQATTILGLLAEIERLVGRTCEVTYAAPRPGDISMSSLSVARIRRDLGWVARVELTRGLEETLRALDS